VPDRRPSSYPQLTSSAEISSEGLLPGAAQAKAELVGRFHYIMLVRNRPRTLGAWRVTTTSPFTADRVAQLLGGDVQQDSTSGLAEILTPSSTVDILLAGPGALDIGWQRTDGSICDSATQDGPQLCICPLDLVQRRAAASQGHGCRPRAAVRFRLQDDQPAGAFDLVSEDWSFVELVTMTQAALSSRETGRPVMARIDLQRSVHTLSGGIVLPYTRPVIRLLADRHLSSRLMVKASAHSRLDDQRASSRPRSHA
jgi:hypothetical protein